MKLGIRKATTGDLLFLEELENQSFPEFQRNSRRSISLSITSPFQEVWIAEQYNSNPVPIAAMILFVYKNALRIYSIATSPTHRHAGAGKYLLNHALMLATSKKMTKLILEANIKNEQLINWYKNFGFTPKNTIKDYYTKGVDALKMCYQVIPHKDDSQKSKNIIVINKPHHWQFRDVNANIVSVKDYINDIKYSTANNIRVFNLCTSYQYQSYGYYVSLLASARGQRVIPGVTTIRDFNNLGIIRSITTECNELLQSSLKSIKTNSFSIKIYFGQTTVRGLKKLAYKLYQLFETPLFEVNFIKDEVWMIKKIHPLTLSKITETEFDIVNNFAQKYFDKKRFNRTRLQSYKYDLAILVNPEDPTPPSCPDALTQFKKAAHRKGIYTEFITKSDIDRINEFDALFIRETTGVNNHTYQISRLAYAEGLVVIDDPWSIVRCSNKIYQNELFRSNKILTPKTTVYTKNFFQPKDLDKVNFPIVIKQPDSAFSLGIIKVNNKDEALETIKKLFKKSDMVIGQEFLYSPFDWRIGIIDNTPLFACKYFMTKGHWQIYSWQNESEEHSGGYETLPISEVPVKVLETARKAASLIGDGLYGVDLKEINGKVYVIEVNDNPNIDAEVEDNYLKEKLYDRIIDSIHRRIEVTKNLNNFFIEK
ncbi:MAG: GNAT family N-acetyltransferase [Marinilabiliaceae bacterium]|nr:GNAT family N-acetyltransferase [Marinilabiliaceae bacterium]